MVKQLWTSTGAYTKEKTKVTGWGVRLGRQVGASGWGDSGS